ncbi:MAG TPA: hypothetical protein VHN99_04810 [Deinococcales bacterium]|nr:hypothetical protein [Deinococcales bacterium]
MTRWRAPLTLAVAAVLAVLSLAGFATAASGGLSFALTYLALALLLAAAVRIEARLERLSLHPRVPEAAHSPGRPAREAAREEEAA